MPWISSWQLCLQPRTAVPAKQQSRQMPRLCQHAHVRCRYHLLQSPPTPALRTASLRCCLQAGAATFTGRRRSQQAQCRHQTPNATSLCVRQQQQSPLQASQVHARLQQEQAAARTNRSAASAAALPQTQRTSQHMKISSDASRWGMGRRV